MSPWTFGMLGGSTLDNGFDLLESQVLSSQQANIDFINLVDKYASVYRHLQIRGTARTSRTSTLDSVQYRFNEDAGSNYAHHNLQNSSGSITSTRATGSMGPISYLPGSNNEANSFGTFICDILDPFNTSKNTGTKSLAGFNDTSWRLFNFWTTSWLNTAQVNSIRLLSDNGSNFLSGSRFSIYGLVGV